MSETSTPSPALGDSADSGEAHVADPSAPVSPDLGSPTQNEPVVITRDMLLSSIPEEIRSESIFQNINAENPIADMAGQFLNAQKLVGVEKMPAPREGWTTEQWDQLYTRIGRPETPDKYSIPESENGPVLDEAALNTFKSLAHESGLTTQQFEKVVEFHNQHYGSLTQQSQEQAQAKIQEGLNALKQEWGDAYNENIAQTTRFFDNEVKDEGLKSLILDSPELRNNPAVIKHFHQLAKDSRESAVRVGDTTNPSAINNSEEAQAALGKFERDNKDLLFKRRESLSLDDRARLDQAIERRTKLYRLAFPE